MLNNSPLLRKTASVDASWLIISSFCSPMVVVKAKDIKRNQIVQLFHHTNTAGFFLFPLEGLKCDTSCLPNTPKATNTTIGNREEKQSTCKKQGKCIKEILISQRVLGCSKCKL
jgi:hypothetical protein